VIPHGVDVHRFRFDADKRRERRQRWGCDGQDSEATFIVGTAGRLVSAKRVDLLIRAAAELVRGGAAVRVVIAGAGPEETRLRGLCRELRIEHVVRFDRFTEDMAGFYGGLDAFALCSETESFGLVIAEAMACERAVVATPTAGARRQIVHGQNGWQLDGFSPEKLAAALEALRVTPDLRRCFGRRGRCDVIERFSIERTLDRTLDALRRPNGRRPRASDGLPRYVQRFPVTVEGIG
jgi:glycosyltransferase involved in cell wall biosynthesis